MKQLNTKVDDLDIRKLKTVPVDLKKLSDIVNNEVAKNIRFNTIKAKVNKLIKKVLDVATLIDANQCKTDQ